LNESGTNKLPPNRDGISRIWRLATKELRETLRDRRTIVTLVMMPLLVYPILSLVFQNFLMSSLGSLTGEDDSAYVIAFTSNLDEASSGAFLSSVGKQILDFEASLAPDDGFEKTEGASESELGQGTLVEMPLDYSVSVQPIERGPDFLHNKWIYQKGISDEFLTQVVAQGDADVGVALEIDVKNFRVNSFRVFERSDGMSEAAGAYVRSRFQQWNDLITQKIIERGGGKLPLSPPIVSKIEIGEDSSSGNTIASLIPLALVLMTITGAVYPAIDLTAGERERGTLETLMAAPVPRMGILLAKFIAVVTVAVMTAILNLIGMTIVMWVFQLDKMLPGGGLSFAIILKVFLLLVLFACFFAACLLMVTSFARSFKEAQAYLVPIILLSLGPGLLATSPSVQLSGLTAVTPMMNLLVLARDVMQGSVNAGAATIAVVSTLVYAFVALAIAARMFGADTILYSQQASLKSLVTRPRKTSKLVPIVSALICLVLLLPVNMVSIGVLGRLGKHFADNFSLFFLLMGAFTILSFFVIPAFIGWMNRANFRSAFGLKGTSIVFFIAAAILGVSLWPIVMVMVESTYTIYGMIAGEAAASSRHDVLVELSSDQVGKFRQVSPILVGLCFALIPAFCEEWFFRGMLLRSLAKEWKAANAILATAVLFGVFHILSNSAVSLDRFLPTMLIGILLGYVAWKSNSIWPGFLLHALHNGTVAFLGYYQKQLSELPWFPDEAEKVPPSWVLVASVVACIGLAIVIKSPRRAD
jgi:membrane protease YdiL (CAAX protease family)/ABC-type transport system involved in multi-copper enzyme maturation permease subunit